MAENGGDEGGAEPSTGTSPPAEADEGTVSDGFPTPRTRLLVADRFAPLVALLLVLALTGGVLTYTTHVEPGSHVEERTVATWESTAAWNHEARVTRSNPVFQRGTTLSDHELYFTRVSPRIEGTFRYSYTASADGNLSTSVATTLVLHSVGERDGETVEYWRVTEPLGRPQATRIAPGEGVRATFATNVSALQQRIDRIEEELSGTPGDPEVRLLTRVRTTGTVNGRPVRRLSEYGATIELDEGTYRVTDAATERERRNTTRTVTVENSYGPLRSTAGPLVLVVGLLGASGLVAARETGRLAVSPATRERLAYEADRREFDDWITTGTVDADALGEPRVEVDSLEGLVDIAIDTDSRVIEDAASGALLVIGTETTYRFEPPAPVEPADEPTSDGAADAGDGGDGGESGDERS
jgi:hypothetical protein